MKKKQIRKLSPPKIIKQRPSDNIRRQKELPCWAHDPQKESLIELITQSSMSGAFLVRRTTSSFLSRIAHNHQLLRSSSSSSSALPETCSYAPSPDDSILLTDNCVRRMKELQASSGEKMLRLGVETGGCSGFQYVFDLDDKVNSEDRLFEREGIKLVVDNISYDFVKGATVDHVEELIRSAFVVTTNPSAVGGCSCRSSFMVKQ